MRRHASVAPPHGVRDCGGRGATPMNLPHHEPPADAAFAQPFWDGAAAGELRLPRCTACGGWYWYPDDVGVCCPEGTLVWTPVAGAGTVHSFTRVQRAFLPGGAADVPFVVVLVDLDGVDGMRLVGNVMGADAEAVAVGQRVAMTFPLIDGGRRPVFVTTASTAP